MIRFPVGNQVKQVERFLTQETLISWILIQSAKLGKNILQCKYLESIGVIDSLICFAPVWGIYFWEHF